MGGANTLTVTEEFDGTNWAETADLSTGRFGGVSGGTSTATLFGGGGDGSGTDLTATEEWTKAATASNWDTT